MRLLHLGLIFVTFRVVVTFSVVTSSGDTSYTQNQNLQRWMRKNKIVLHNLNHENDPIFV